MKIHEEVYENKVFLDFVKKTEELFLQEQKSFWEFPTISIKCNMHALFENHISSKAYCCKFSQIDLFQI